MHDRQAVQSQDDDALDERIDAALGRGIELSLFDNVLDVLVDVLHSPSGAFGRLDEFGDVVCQAVRGSFGTRETTPICHARDVCLNSWSSALESLAPRISNEPERVVQDGPVLSRSLTVPIVFGAVAVGFLCVAEREAAYHRRDRTCAVRIARRVAPYLFARSSQQRFRRQLTELEEMANAAAEGERFFMLSGDLMAIAENHVVRTNPAFSRQLGWDDQEIRDKPLPDLAHPADRDAFARDLTRMRTEPNREHPPIVVRMRAKDGQYRSIEWTGAATKEGRVYAVGRDVSELRGAVARLEVQNEELHALHERIRREQRLAGQLLANVRQQGCLDMPGVRHLTSPLDFFNGDVALAATTPTGQFRFMLGDFTGHGLSAAVGTIPVASTFYATCRKGVALVESVETINDLLKGLLPAGLFCAAAVLALDLAKGELLVWNGGLPSVIVRNTQSGSLRLQTSQSLPLGLVASHELDVQFNAWTVDAADEIFVYSDGLTEAQNSRGEMFGQDRLAEIVGQAGTPGDGFDRVVNELNAHRGSAAAADDVSLIAVTVGALRASASLRPDLQR